jgi:hypothetical protein
MAVLYPTFTVQHRGLYRQKIQQRQYLKPATGHHPEVALSTSNHQSLSLVKSTLMLSSHFRDLILLPTVIYNRQQLLFWITITKIFNSSNFLISSENKWMFNVGKEREKLQIIFKGVPVSMPNWFSSHRIVIISKKH